MSALSWVPDVLRETRYLFGTASCPWGVIGLSLCAASIGCFWLGFLLGAVLFSQRCRAFGFSVLQLAASCVLPNPQVDLRGRLAEYRRGF